MKNNKQKNKIKVTYIRQYILMKNQLNKEEQNYIASMGILEWFKENLNRYDNIFAC